MYPFVVALVSAVRDECLWSLCRRDRDAVIHLAATDSILRYCLAYFDSDHFEVARYKIKFNKGADIALL